MKRTPITVSAHMLWSVPLQQAVNQVSAGCEEDGESSWVLCRAAEPQERT